MRLARMDLFLGILNYLAGS